MAQDQSKAQTSKRNTDIRQDQQESAHHTNNNQHTMNVFIPGYKPTVQDPKKDVSKLPKELMSKMPEKTGTTVPGGVPEANMSRMPTAPQTMSVAPTKPAQSVNPIVNPIGANITGVPTAVNPIMQQTAKETPKMEVP